MAVLIARMQVALRSELSETQEIAQKLDAMYKLAEQEAGRLRVQFKAQEDDRQHLIRYHHTAHNDVITPCLNNGIGLRPLATCSTMWCLL